MPPPRRAHPDPRVAAWEHTLAETDRAIIRRLDSFPLVEVQAGGFALQPLLRVAINQEAIGLDDVAMLHSWRITQVARALATDTLASALEPVNEPALVPLTAGALPSTGATSPHALRPHGLATERLAAALHRVRQSDDARITAGGGPRWENVNVLAGPGVPWRTVYSVMHTLAAEGFDQVNLAVRRGGRTVALALNVPGEESPTVAPVLPVRVEVRPDGTTVSVDGETLTRGCSTAGVPFTMPWVNGQPDTAALTGCMVTLRDTSQWHVRLGAQRTVHIALAGNLPWRVVVATVAATQDATPGARDLFTNPVLELLP